MAEVVKLISRNWAALMSGKEGTGIGEIARFHQENVISWFTMFILRLGTFNLIP